MKHLSTALVLLFIATGQVYSQELQPFSDYNYAGKKLMGYKDEAGIIVVPAKYRMAETFRDGLAKVGILDKSANWKYGFIDKTGKEVIPLLYSSIADYFSEDLIVAELNGKWGFLNKEGKVVVEFKYEHAKYSGFNEGLAGVRFEGKYGFIDKGGHQKVSFNYEDCKKFSEGLAAVQSNGKWGFVDATGKVIIPMSYSNAIDFSGGLAGVKYNDKWAVINKEGKLLTSFKYDDVDYNYSAKGAELIEVSNYNKEKIEHKYGVVDKRGNEVIPVKYYSVTVYTNDLIKVELERNKAGLVNSRNKVVLPLSYPGVYIDFDKTPQGRFYETSDRTRVFSFDGDEVNIWKYEDVEDEHEGRRAVMYNNKWGFIDEKGAEIIQPVYDTADRFYGSYAMVMLNKKIGCIDKAGKVIIPVIYDYIGLNSEDLFLVANNNKWGFVDGNGKEVIALKYDNADSFGEGLAAVLINKKIGFINKAGTEVIAPQFDEILTRFSQGKARVKKDGKEFYIDQTGKEIIR